MQILITGGAGFIGSNLCGYFVGKGFDAVCLDNLSTGFMHNIVTLMEKKNFRFIKSDMLHLQVPILKDQVLLTISSNMMPYLVSNRFVNGVEII